MRQYFCLEAWSGFFFLFFLSDEFHVKLGLDGMASKLKKKKKKKTFNPDFLPISKLH